MLESLCGCEDLLANFDPRVIAALYDLYNWGY